MKKLLFLITVICLSTLSANAGGIKTSYRNALILAYSQANSVYEDDNIKLEIYDEQLWAINKTSKTIFIDVAQCFVFHNGRSIPLKGDANNKKGDDKKASKRVSAQRMMSTSLLHQLWATNRTTLISVICL